MPTILLIHGTWTGGFLWQKLRAPLAARGHTVFTPTLTGLGERAHLLTRQTDLDTHIRDLTAVVEYERLDDIVVVAHSYGGMLATALADRLPGRIAAAVFINAGLPKDGETMLDFQTAERIAELMALVEAEGDGFRVPRRLLLKTGLNDPAEEAAFLARTCDHPLRALTTPLAVGDGLAKVSQKLHVTSEHASKRFSDDHEWATAQADWQTAKLGVSHFPMLTDPEATVELIDALLR